MDKPTRAETMAALDTLCMAEGVEPGLLLALLKFSQLAEKMREDWVECRGAACTAKIKWIKTKKGREMPVERDGTPHHATCPNASQFRGGRGA